MDDKEIQTQEERGKDSLPHDNPEVYKLIPWINSHFLKKWINFCWSRRSRRRIDFYLPNNKDGIILASFSETETLARHFKPAFQETETEKGGSGFGIEHLSVRVEERVRESLSGCNTLNSVLRGPKSGCHFRSCAFISWTNSEKPRAQLFLVLCYSSSVSYNIHHDWKWAKITFLVATRRDDQQ